MKDKSVRGGVRNPSDMDWGGLGGRFRWVGSSVLALGLAVAWSGCQDPGQRALFEETETVAWPLDAFCTATVRGVGDRDVEMDYVASVVACENGGADFEALKAQAVAARTYLYFKMETSGSIADGTSDQVYTCNRPARAEHYEAAAQTVGEVLRHDGVTLAGFYVAGAIPTTPDCVPADGDRDPTSTERFVTYNEGRFGGEVQPTSLGHPANPRNRGCKSQNGAHCLAEKGWLYQDILRFYYGEDVEFVVAEGDCVDAMPRDCEIVVEGAETIIDEEDACFSRSCNGGEAWWNYGEGIDGASVATYTVDAAQADCVGVWQVQVAQAGRYRVEAHVPQPVPLSRQATYTVTHGGQSSQVTVSQADAQGWVSLGDFEFAAGGDQSVSLADNTGEAYTGQDGTRIIFDAIALRPAIDGPDMPDAGGEPDSGGEPDGGGEPDMGGMPDDPNNDDGPNNSVPDDPNNGFEMDPDDGMEPGNSEDDTDVRSTEFSEGCAHVSAPTAPAGWPLGVMLGLGLVVGRARRRRR